MPKFHRGSAPPTGAMMDLRNTRIYGSRDEQIAAAAERSRGCPDPDRQIVYTRGKRTARAKSGGSTKLSVPDVTPAQHSRNVELLERNMAALQERVRYLRECGGDWQSAATRARELRHAYLQLTGGLDRRTLDIDLGSVVNPMVAV